MSDSPSPSLGVLHGLRTVPRAMQLLRELPRVLRLLLIPLVLTAVLDGLAFYYGFGWLRARLAAALPDTGAWHALRGVLGFLTAALVLLLLAWTFSFVYLLLCELVVDAVSEEVEEHLHGRHTSAQSLSSRVRGVLFGLVQSLFLWGAGLFSLLLGLIPIVGPVLTLLLSASVLGYGFFAIAAGRQAQPLAARYELFRAQLGAISGLGFVVFLANLVPVVNLLALPIFVVAGTLLYLDATNAPPKGAARAPQPR